MAEDFGRDRRTVSMGRRQHLRPGTAVLCGHAGETGTNSIDLRCSRAGLIGRLGDDRPHQPGRLDQGRLARGTFANIRLKNLLCPGTEGGVTKYLPTGQQMSIFDAAMKYKEQGIPLVVLAGEEYGTGSSRDWAAKGTYLLGVRAVIAKSFERIHRSNLVGMGVLPLQFRDSENREHLGLDGTETFDISLDESLKPRQAIEVTAAKPDGTTVRFTTACRIDTPVEVEYYRNGGILHKVLRDLARL